MTGVDARLSALFNPRSVAVIGATEDRNRVGGRPLHYLRTFGYAGAVYPINPKREWVQGFKAYASLDELPEVPDVAVLAVGSEQVQAVLAQCAFKGIRSAVVMSSGFAETGAEGVQRQACLVDQAKALGIRLVGPNAQGVANFSTGAVLNFSTMFMEVAPQDGPVAIISQSGAASVMPYAMLRERGVGVRYLVASGNDADTSVNDLALVAATDPNIRVVLMYIESLPDPDTLAQVARTARSNGAAVIALKSGRSAQGAKAAASHTGAIVNDDTVVDAFLDRHGIWRAQDVHGMVNAVELYLAAPPRPAQQLVVMSHSGAVGVLCADTAEFLGLPLTELAPSTATDLARIMPSFATAQNPVDMTASLMTQGGMFSEALNILACDPGADMFLIGVPVAGPGYDVPGMAADVAKLAISQGKPVVVSAPQESVRSAFRQAGVPVFRHETDALHALHQWSRHAALMAQALARESLPACEETMPRVAAGRHGFLNEADSLQLLSQSGIPTVPFKHCRNLQEAREAWHALGPAAVLKASSEHLPHKSEHGLVFLDIDSEAALEIAWQTCAERVNALNIAFEGAIVAKRVSGRREFALGVKQDPSFGTVVMLSDGGKYVEALRDFVVLLHPFSEDHVLQRLRQLRVFPILAGVRGEAPVDLGIIASVAVKIGQLAAANADSIASIDLNPLMIHDMGSGGLAVDAVVELKGSNLEQR